MRACEGTFIYLLACIQSVWFVVYMDVYVIDENIYLYLSNYLSVYMYIYLSTYISLNVC